MIDIRKTACFTGHRNIQKNQEKRIGQLLDIVIEHLYQKGVVYYGAGGAYGFDMLAEHAVLRAKTRHNDIKLILVLPCPEHDKYWTHENKYSFSNILSQADKISFTSQKYWDGCMLKRNRHLVEFSGYCIAFLEKKLGRHSVHSKLRTTKRP